MAQSFAHRLANYQRQIEQHLPSLIPMGVGPSAVLSACMKHSLLAGGKRIRPVLLLFTAEALVTIPDQVLPTACAVEFIHTATLMLDDLPCMDNATMRRGQPSSHFVYGEANTIIAATAMLCHAIQIIVSNAAVHGLSPSEAEALVASVIDCISVHGVAGGQVTDLQSASSRPLSLDMLIDMHRRKTASLLVLPIRLACQLCRAPAPILSGLLLYAEKVGLAFQVLDDVLDSTATTEVLGKDAQQDAGKSTFVAVLGVDAARRFAEENLVEAKHILEGLPTGLQSLAELLDFIRLYAQAVPNASSAHG